MTNDELLKIIDQAADEDWEELDLSGNELTQLPSEIGKLINLKKLILGKWDKKSGDYIGNRLTTLPSEISNLKNLEKLSLKHNRLTQLPSSIGQLSSLKTLYLRGNKLNCLPIEIFSLTSLQELSISCNQLSVLSPEIGRLSSLKKLYLHENILSDLPREISKLIHLELIYLSDNRLKTLPSEIGNLSSLKTLYLDNNQLSNLPSEIGNLSSLKTLYLDNNQLKTLPSEIGNLSSLIEIGIYNNKLKNLPTKVIELPCLKQLNLRGNQLKNFPPEMAVQELKTLRNYVRQLKLEGYDTIYEAKLLIVGEAGSGKTSLMNKILNPNYKVPQTEKPTHGIQIKTFPLPCSNNQELKVNIWDFGGQEIWHQTHKFFLTKRSLYVLVSDSRKEHPHLDYWLHLIQLLGDNSPLLIIKNENNNYSVEIKGESQILDDFYPMVKDILTTNLADNRGLEQIIETVKLHINQLPQVGIKLPKSWANVRQAIEQDYRDYISLQEYLEICDSHEYTYSISFDDNEKNSTITDSRLRLSQFFHELGVILHFQDDEASLLYDTIILNPEWATKAVYALLRIEDNPIKEKFGKFTYADLKTIWSNERYQGKYRELLELMKRFKLCYELPNKTYIAPQLLEDKKPPHYHWDNKDNLRLRYRYDFMPKGILSRFIVEMNPYIDEPNVWRSGVILNKDNTKAEVIENYYDREIQIRLRGNNKRGLLEVITSELDKIHISYHNLKVDKLIPCNCNTCITIQDPYFHRLENLRNLLSKNSQVSQCQISGELVNIYTLIDDTIGRQELNKPNSKNVINFNINQGDDMNNPINQNHSGNGDNAVGKTTNKIVCGPVGALDSTFHGQSQAIGQSNETPSQDLAEVAKEIQCLLDQLSQTYPTETKKDQKHFAVEAIDRIEQNPSLTQKLLSATKAGSFAALDSLLNHPAASFVIAAIDDLQND